MLLQDGKIVQKDCTNIHAMSYYNLCNSLHCTTRTKFCLMDLWRFCLFCDNGTNLHGNQLMEKWEILPQTWLPRQTTVTTSVNYYKLHYWPHSLFLVALIIGNMQISNSEAHFQSFHQSNLTPGGQNFVKGKTFHYEIWMNLISAHNM